MKSEKKRQSEEESRSPMSKINIGYIMITVLVITVLNSYLFSASSPKTIPYSEFLAQIEAGNITNVTISDDTISGELKTEKGQPTARFITNRTKEEALTQRLYSKNIPFSVEVKNPTWGFLLSWILPGFFIYFLWSFLGRGMAGMGAGMLSLTKSKAKVYMEKDINTTFNDVAGIEEAKGELNEIVSYLQDPKRYTRLGGRAPKGVLLMGPPGTGKTLLARAVAGEAKVPFFSINGSEFVEMFVGLGAARVRDLFEQAKKQAPCILFIDEIDALGKSRAFGLMGTGTNDEKEQTLNQLLAEMDGFDSSEGVIMLAATNRPEILDPALLRAGRFDRQILLGNPDQQGRIQILKVHTQKIKLDPEVNLARIASMTPGFSGADLANLVNEAALVATRKDAIAVTEKDFSEAIERLIAGLEKKSKVMNQDEKKRVAFHELGHATVALGLDVADKVHKISIIPRGMNALGYTLQRPLEDRYLLDEEEMKSKIAVLLGGRASETIHFKSVSTGAADDLAKASDIARAMVTQFGMSKALGLESFDVRRAPFLQSAYDVSLKQVSEGTSREIDIEVKSILDGCFQRALGVLKKNKLFLNEAAKKLLETETLDEAQIVLLWENHHRTMGTSQFGAAPS
jgi:cell division protease FtsH